MVYFFGGQVLKYSKALESDFGRGIPSAFFDIKQSLIIGYFPELNILILAFVVCNFTFYPVTNVIKL